VVPRLYPFGIRNIISAAAEVEIVDHVESMMPQFFETEDAAQQFWRQNSAVCSEPVVRCELSDHSTDRFSVQRFADYPIKPAQTGLDMVMDLTFYDPVKCVLADDWEFQLIAANASRSLSHTTRCRYPGKVGIELLRALEDLEKELFSIHPQLSTAALRHFWLSFELHRHFILLPLRLWQFGEPARAVAEAVVTVRSHLSNYVADVLRPQNTRKPKKPVRQNPKYERIDEALREAAEAQPKDHEEVFRILDSREVPTPNRMVFKRAGSYLKGFRENPGAASTWLSRAWAKLGLPAFVRGPKKKLH